MQSLGYNYRITDIQCALGISQLRKLDTFLKRRREIAAIYNEGLSKLDGLILPVEKSCVRSSWHLYCIRIKEFSKRKSFFIEMRKAGIGVQVHYLPAYRHPFYQKSGYKRLLCRNAEEFYRQEISIPIYPRMQNKQAQFVIERIEEALR
jgi:perosamine synthetase